MMLFYERLQIQLALKRKARMNKVRDLFRARDAISNWAPPIVFCYLCDDNLDHCDHDKCCQDSMDDPYNMYCPRCGEFMQEDDDY